MVRAISAAEKYTSEYNIFLSSCFQVTATLLTGNVLDKRFPQGAQTHRPCNRWVAFFVREIAKRNVCSWKTAGGRAAAFAFAAGIVQLLAKARSSNPVRVSSVSWVFRRAVSSHGRKRDHRLPMQPSCTVR